MIWPAMTSSPSGLTFAEGVRLLNTSRSSPSREESSTISTELAQCGISAPVFIHLYDEGPSLTGVACAAPIVEDASRAYPSTADAA